MSEPVIGSNQNTAFSLSRLQQNKFFRLGLIALVAVLLVVTSIYLINLRRSAAQRGLAENGNLADTPPADIAQMLPQNRRDTVSESEAIWFARDPFASPLKLTGIVTGGWGELMAIVESGSTATIVTAGDMVGEVWTVIEIKNDSVILQAADREVILQLLSDGLWADASGSPGIEKPATGSISVITLDVRDASILDVLSILSVKLNAQIIFLEQPTVVTFKSTNLSALTTFQLFLQKYGLDYFYTNGFYLVGYRERLYDDFYNRMYITRYKTTYISAQTLQSLIGELGIPVENVTIDVNTQQIWVQGTPIALGKFMELINTVDCRENAEFNTGGNRIIRMPVSYAEGINAEKELDALIKLLSILLDGYIDGTGEWYYWNQDWDEPTIRPGEIKMKISPNIADDTIQQSQPIHYLIVEGTPDHIELVRKMIAEISGSMSTLPFSFSPLEESDDDPQD